MRPREDELLKKVEAELATMAKGCMKQNNVKAATKDRVVHIREWISELHLLSQEAHARVDKYHRNAVKARDDTRARRRQSTKIQGKLAFRAIEAA